MCRDCEEYDGQSFSGEELRLVFPYLEIVDQDLIYPKVHPNCRCALIRVSSTTTNL
jgi:hypothetical protein